MRRERLTITLDETILEAVDSTVDGSKVRNRSQAIEHLIREGLHLHALTDVVVYEDSPGFTDIPALAAIIPETAVVSVVTNPSNPSFHTSLSASLSSLLPGASIRTLAGDFGTASALTLLTNPSDVVTIGVKPNLYLPASLVPLFVHHHEHHADVSELAHRVSTGFEPTTVRVMSVRTLNEIPAGRSDLTDVFSNLVKAGRVSVYVD